MIRITRKKIIFFFLTAFGIAVTIFLISRSKSIKNLTSLNVPLEKKRQEVFPDTIPRMPLKKAPPPLQQKAPLKRQVSESTPDAGKTSRKKLVLDLDNLDVLKNLEQNQEKKGTDNMRNTFLQEKNNFMEEYSETNGPTKIYENGRLKIKGSAGLTEFPKKIEPLDKMKDKLEMEGNITIDF